MSVLKSNSQKNMKDKFKAVLKMGVIPVVTVDDVNNADSLAEALIEGGLPCAEITYRTAVATEVIKKLSTRGDLIVGAGTVLDTEQVKQAIDSGACFIISPYLNKKVVRYCLDSGIPVVPGVSTPTEIGHAVEIGLSIVKFFPAEALGGLKTLDAISAPFNMIKFIPAGGIGPKNLAEYLNHSKVIACGGSWMVKSSLITEKKFDEIIQLTKEAIMLSREAGQ
jgi:2-dehydro-3-deoxyphosphogluconate aldolase/(4S)-4-hydroxy-2-oxoglutarate aldolase